MARSAAAAAPRRWPPQRGILHNLILRHFRMLAKGTSLGPYEIVAHLGSGGMGEVWRARDRRIGRDVAIKVLPEAFAPKDERLQRFEQEARAAGALNHPGLVIIFDVGNVDG